VRETGVHARARADVLVDVKLLGHFPLLSAFGSRTVVLDLLY
jgi:hypothetical protein